ncbi:MAG: hypothetical protein HYS12_05010 [Planctomycetes bacterium]|nr:hypothetical protein [Planctomycetota bacterium]
MGTRERKQAVLSLGAVLAMLGVLALAGPGFLGLAQAEKVGKESAAPSKDDTRLGVTERQQALKGEEGCCCARSGRAACSAGGETCCCGKKLLAQAGPGSAALALKAQDKPKDSKEEMKASPGAMAKGTAARKAILDHQKALGNDGVFSCCIRPGCTFCSSSADMCPCAMNLRKGGPVCPECWGGWQVGQGRLDGVDAAKVQVIPKSKLKMMYEMKSMNFKKASEGADKK